MDSRHEPPRPSTTVRLLALAFATIAALFGSAFAVAVHAARNIQDRIDLVIQNQLESVSLVAQMARDLDEERRLLDVHILEVQGPTMASTERRIADKESDFAAAAGRYEPLVTLPGEREVWTKLTGQIAALHRPIAEVLALSRANADADARRGLAAIDRRFAAIHAEVGELIRINHDGAATVAAEMTDLQLRLRWLLGLVSAGGIIAALTVGVVVTRIVASRERRLALFAATLELRNRELDAFAGRVAHDLRGPLSTVNVAAAALEQAPVGKARQWEIMHRSIASMSAVIDDLLALSRLDAHPTGVISDPRAATQLALDQLAERIEREGASVSVSVEPGAVACLTEGLLCESVWNLVDNALKYRDPGSSARIEITGRAVASRYELRVADHGIGLSPEEARRAFDPRYRAMRSRDAPGMGIGLSVVKRAIEAVGGRVRIESQPGHGATFVLDLRMAALDPEPAQRSASAHLSDTQH
jgi:signal transduction histidine kinase